MGRNVLSAVLQPQLVPVDQGLDAAQRCEGRQDDDVGRYEILVRQPPAQLLREGDGLEVVVVHLPVAHDQGLPGVLRCHGRSSAASPGRVVPSRYSRLAPPPVEMWLKPSSGSPSRRTAAAESPPPTTVRPGSALIARATALVPAANAGNSKTPTGPFQNTVAASASLPANSSRVAGPMSRLSRSAGNAVTGYTACSASGAKSAAPTRSTGSTSSTPRSSASVMTFLTSSRRSASSKDLPTS